MYHHFTSLPHNFTSFFVTVIPKVKNPCSLGDFRHISLVGSLYKLIVKVLANRPGSVMENMISPSQTTSLKGRLLVDRMVVVNEFIDLDKVSI